MKQTVMLSSSKCLFFNDYLSNITTLFFHFLSFVLCHLLPFSRSLLYRPKSNFRSLREGGARRSAEMDEEKREKKLEEVKERVDRLNEERKRAFNEEREKQETQQLQPRGFCLIM